MNRYRSVSVSCGKNETIRFLRITGGRDMEPRAVERFTDAMRDEEPQMLIPWPLRGMCCKNHQ
jgi:hypothetical protein